MPISIANPEEDLEKIAGGVANVTSGAAKAMNQQRRATTKSFVAQLYGVSKSTDPTAEDREEIKKEAIVSAYSPFQTPEQMQQRQLAKLKTVQDRFPGIQTPEDQQAYELAQKKLDKESRAEIEKQRIHAENYYRSGIGTLDDELRRVKAQRQQQEDQERQEEEEEKKKREEEEKQQKEEEMAALVAAQGKRSKKGQTGRNRMGHKASMDLDLSVKRARNRAESFRGASG